MTTQKNDRLFLLAWSETRRIWRITARIERCLVRLRKKMDAGTGSDAACTQIAVDAIVLLHELHESCVRTVADVRFSLISNVTPGPQAEMLASDPRWTQIDGLIRGLLDRVADEDTEAQIAILSEIAPIIVVEVYAWSSERFGILRRGLTRARRIGAMGSTSELLTNSVATSAEVQYVDQL